VLWSAYVSCETLEQGRKFLEACLLMAVASRKNKKVSVCLVTAIRIVTDESSSGLYTCCVRCSGLRFWECTSIRSGVFR
jgi:hypothetical protein